MTGLRRIGILSVVTFTLASSAEDFAQPAEPRIAIVPLPSRMTPGRGVFTLHGTTPIVTDASLRARGRQLASLLAPATGFDLPVRAGAAPRDRAAEPLAICGFLPLEQVYGWDPMPPALEPQFHRHVLGVQGQLWSECLPTAKAVEYMTYPRLTALAEVAWTQADRRQMDEFRARLSIHLERLRILDVNFRPLNP